MSEDKKGRVPTRLMEWFGRALMAADSDVRAHDEEKGESWREERLEYLFDKMMKHANKTKYNMKTGHVHAIKVVNYALMIATRVAGAEVGDKVAEEVEWKGQNITIVSAYSGVTRMKPNENIIEKIPLETESEDDE